MKKIKAYHCDFCKKITMTKSGMFKHEKKCFYNPNTNSCATCDNLVLKNCINGKVLSEHENRLLRFEIEGTFHLEWDTSPDSNGEEWNVLNEEYQYLYNAEPENYCNSKSTILHKLTTKCPFHKAE